MKRSIIQRGITYSMQKYSRVYSIIPDDKYLALRYWAMLDKKIDLRNPKSFNEKMQWLKLYDRNPNYTKCVDKCEVKRIVADAIGEEYIIPLLGVWDKFEDINFEELPNQFVLKCTHDSGGVFICKDKKKLDKDKAEKILNKSLARSYYSVNREWPYKELKPRIIAEEYKEDSSTGELRDYKFFCFNGKVKCFKVDYGRFKDHHANYYDKDGHVLELGEELYPPIIEKKIEMPQNLLLMEEFAEKLSSGIPFVRVDFYEVDGRVYFGELTFYPASGFGAFVFEGNDEMMGEWIDLPYQNMHKE